MIWWRPTILIIIQRDWWKKTLKHSMKLSIPKRASMPPGSIHRWRIKEIILKILNRNSIIKIKLIALFICLQWNNQHLHNLVINKPVQWELGTGKNGAKINHSWMIKKWMNILNHIYHRSQAPNTDHFEETVAIIILQKIN